MLTRPLPRLTPLRTGVIAAAAVAFLLSMAISFSTSAFGSGDEFAHYDHAYQIWHGHLPLPDPPQRMMAFRHWGHGNNQFTGQHPPLFYLIGAPIIGPLNDHHHQLAAVYFARSISALSAAGLVLAVVLLAKILIPSRPRLWLVAGLITAVYPTVVAVGGAYYNDNFAALFNVLVVAAVCAVIRKGPGVRGFAWIGIASTLALYTRAASMFVIAGAVGVLGLWLLARRAPQWRWVAVLAGFVGLAVASVAWFYIRNIHYSGSVTGGGFSSFTPSAGHKQQSVLSAVSDPDTWHRFFSNFGYKMWDNDVATVALLAVPLLIAAVLIVIGLARAPRQRSWMVAAVALGACLVVAGQIGYTAKGGQATSRYMEPLVPVFGLAIAYALTWRRALTLPLTLLWTAAAVGPLFALLPRQFSARPGQGAAPKFPTDAMWSLTLAAVALTAIFIVLRDVKDDDPRMTPC